MKDKITQPNILPKDPFNCPYLILAPMEGVGDQFFRKAMTSIGGFDEAVRDFLRVPANAHVKSLASQYHADEMSPIPLAAQIMGSDPDLMAAMAKELEKRGAPRIDINLGCPSNIVNARGAGSSMLKDPNLVYKNAKAVVEAVSIPVTAKMRSGFEDISLFKENLFAAQESKITYLTLHPRTKVEGYRSKANWDLIAEAKRILKIPVVGNGDIFTKEDALKMVSYTKCDALMIGRGSLINPFIFLEIRAHFDKKKYHKSLKDLEKYIHLYIQQLPNQMSEKTKINKMKQLLYFIFEGNAESKTKRQTMLTNKTSDFECFMRSALSFLFPQK